MATRIKDFVSTATTTAADDFLAVDGATNDTRKMNAAAPAFLTSVTAPLFQSAAGANLAVNLGTAGTGTTSFNASTDATNSTTAGVTIAGGLAVAKKLYVGTNIYGVGATSSVILGAATEILTIAATAAGAGTITAKSGQTVTVASSLLASAPGITVGSGTGVTVNSASEVRRVVYKATFTYAAFAAAALTADKTIATLPAKTRLIGVYADVTTPFTGGAVSAATMTFGKTAGGNEYLVSFDVLSGAITRGLVDGDLGTSINRAGAIQDGDMPSWGSTTALSARLTTVSANTDQLTAGSVTFYLCTEALP